MHVIPPNGFPNVPSFADLDAIAKQIENIPTFTSNDRAFLEELPVFPSEDGTKVLKATTTSGETSLSYGVVETGENVVYSTTPVEIGTWIDGKKVKRVVIDLQNAITLLNNDWTSLGVTPPADVVRAISCIALKSDGICYMYCEINITSSNIAIQQYSGANKTASTFIIEYVSSET